MKEVEWGGIQIQAAIDAAIGRLGGLAGTKPVAVVAASPAHFPLLAGDESIFNDILAGLLAHAIINTDRDEIRIRAQLMPAGLVQIPENLISPGFDTSAGPWALISITDNEGGFLPGMQQDEISDAFAMDKQHSYKDCEDLIAQLGGFLWTEEHDAAASTIWVGIPLKATVSASADSSQVRKAVETHLPDDDTHGKSILLYIEDEVQRKQLTAEFVSDGYRVVICPEKTDILPLARAELPDLLILDLQTREPTAFDLASLLKQDPQLARIPVMVLTTIPDPEGGLRMETAGFLVRSEGTGAMLATVQAALSTGVAPSARVLVVEADDALREQMIVHIQARGHPVVEASSAEEALALTERVRLGVVLANASLVQARDYWLLRQLKSSSPDLEVYVLAESLSDEDGRAAVKRGAAGFGDTGRLPELLKKMGQDRDVDTVE